MKKQTNIQDRAGTAVLGAVAWHLLKLAVVAAAAKLLIAPLLYCVATVLYLLKI